MFHCLPDYAWAVGNMAEAARQLDKLVEHRPRSQVYEDMGRHVHCRIISGIGKVACGHLNLIKCIIYQARQGSLAERNLPQQIVTKRQSSTGMSSENDESESVSE